MEVERETLKVTIPRSVLSRMIRGVSRAIPRHSINPALGCVLLEAKGGVLSAVATDLACFVRIAEPADVRKEGLALVPAGPLERAVASKKGGDVLLAAMGNSMMVSDEEVVVEISGRDPEDFPNFPPCPLPSPERWVETDVQRLRTAIDRTSFSDHEDPSRPVYSGIHFAAGDGVLRLTGTDGWRIARDAVAASVPASLAAVVPVRAVRLFSGLLDALKVKNGIARFGISPARGFRGEDLWAWLEAGPVQVVVQALEMKYPDPDTFAPTEVAARACVRRMEMLNVLNRIASFLTSDRSPAVRLQFEKDSVLISAEPGDGMRINTKAPASLEGEEMEALFNVHFLREPLRAVEEGEEVVFEIQEPCRPVKISSPSDPDYVYVLMPMADD